MRRRSRVAGFVLTAAAVMLSVCLGGRVSVRAAEENSGNAEDLMILYTSDVLCGVDQGFGYDGLFRVREVLEAKGSNVILVDGGDAIDGAAIGSMTKGGSIIELMNEVGYDIAVPGEQEFHYGAGRLLELAKEADFPYISCNFNYKGEPVFAPYLIRESDAFKVAFVGVTIPGAEEASSGFTDENGGNDYDFCLGNGGEDLISAVQSAVDKARSEGADYVVAVVHLGGEQELSPYTGEEIIAKTAGIDVFFDAHSQDHEQVILKNKNGEDVIRSACGTRLDGIGWVKLTKGGEKSAGLYSWNNKVPVFDLFGLNNKVTQAVNRELEELEKLMADGADSAAEAAGESESSEAKMAPPVEVQIEDGLLTTDIFKMQIPESWEGKYVIDARAIVDKNADLSKEPEGGYEEYYIDFFEKQSFEETNQRSGVLFSIAVTNEKISEYDLTPSEYRGSMVNKDLNEIHHISVWYPSDVQWVEAARDQYLTMFDEKEDVISSMKGRNGFSFARNPFESKDYTSGKYNANLIEYAHSEGGSSITAVVSKYATLSSGDVKALNQYIGVLSDSYIIYKPIPVAQSQEILGIDLTEFLKENSPVPGYFVKSKVATKPNSSDTYGYVREVDGVYYVYPIPKDTAKQPAYCLNDYLATSTYRVTEKTKLRLFDESGKLQEVSVEEFYAMDSRKLFSMFSEVEAENGELASLTQIR